jgi:hypothetical protein
MRRLFRNWMVLLLLACLLTAPVMAAPASSGSPGSAWHQMIDTAAAWWAGLAAAVGPQGGSTGTSGTGQTTGGDTSTSGADGDHGSSLDPNG